MASITCGPTLEKAITSVPLADAFGGLAADRFGPAFVCVLTGLLTFVINGPALFRREIRQLE